MEGPWKASAEVIQKDKPKHREEEVLQIETSLPASLVFDSTYCCTAAMLFYHFLPAIQQMSFAKWIILNET